jgi:hypothetical protein
MILQAEHRYKQALVADPLASAAWLNLGLAMAKLGGSDRWTPTPRRPPFV